MLKSSIKVNTRSATLVGLCLLMLLQVILPVNPVYADAADPFEEWLLLGPVDPPRAAQPEDREAVLEWFRSDLLPPDINDVEAGSKTAAGGRRYVWQPVSTQPDGGVDLDEFFESDLDQQSCYAWTSWKVASAQTALVDFGTADAARIWLNGELVYEKDIRQRGLAPRSLISLDLQQGNNSILIRIQNLPENGWGFGLSPVDEEELAGRFVEAAFEGNIDLLRELAELGVDVNVGIGPEFRAIHAAELSGRQGVVSALEELGASTSEDRPEPAELASFLIEREIDENDPGLALMLIQGDRILFDRAFGLADVSDGRRLSTGSTFRIGSVTKQFTAAAILHLSDQGLLSIEDPLSTYIDGFERGEDISLRMLLNHTSGLHSYTGEEDFLEEVSQPVAAEELIERIKSFKMDFEPGTNWAYCNSGYFLLGRIIEMVSGMSYGDFLQETFFGPLGMQQTQVYVNNTDGSGENEAIGHQLEADSFRKALDWQMEWAGAAGNLSSNTADLMKWNTAVYADKLLPVYLLEDAHRAATLINGEEANAWGSRYGLGWMLMEFRGQQIIGHGGGLNGFVSFLGYLPKEDIHVAVLANAAPGNWNAQETASLLVQVFFPEIFEPAESFESVETSDIDLSQYEGRYEYPGGAIMVIRSEDGSLFGQLSGQPELELFARGEDAFYWKVVEASLTFTRDADGVITGGVHSQGGAELVVPKIEEVEEAEVSAEVVETLAGTYDFQGQDMLISFRDGQLYLKIGAQPELQLFPKNETEWFLKAVQASVIFNRDDAGKVTMLTLLQGGQEFSATRKE